MHGARSQRVAAGALPSQADALALMADRRAEIIQDLGGAAQLSAIARDTINRYLELGMVADYLAENIQRSGPLTGKGRQRAALTAWLQVIDRQQRLGQLLGLTRREKPIGGLGDVARAVAEANR